MRRRDEVRESVNSADRLSEIRKAERESHIEAYIHNELYAPGSWLAKPVKTVLDILPLFEGCSEFRALDLGCGVGRNSIPVAQAFSHIPCRVDCVDILDMAIKKLLANAVKYGVADRIRGVISSIDEYEISTESYDFIMGISALEHCDSKTAFVRKLGQICDGVGTGGIACLIVNSGVTERDEVTGAALPPRFEVNLPTAELQRILEGTFKGWEMIKHTVTHQKYGIPRERCTAELESDVVTWVVRKR